MVPPACTISGGRRSNSREGSGSRSGSYAEPPRASQRPANPYFRKHQTAATGLSHLRPITNGRPRQDTLRARHGSVSPWMWNLYHRASPTPLQLETAPGREPLPAHRCNAVRCGLGGRRRILSHTHRSILFSQIQPSRSCGLAVTTLPPRPWLPTAHFLFALSRAMT